MYLDHDGAVIYFGADEDVSLTHVADTGLRLNSNMQIQFRDANIYIQSNSDGYLKLRADAYIELNHEAAVTVYHDDGNATLWILSRTDDAILDLDCGDDGVAEEAKIRWKQDRTSKWALSLSTSNHLYLYDYVKGATIVEFQDNAAILVNSGMRITGADALSFRDSAIYVDSPNDGHLRLNSDSRVWMSIATTKVFEVTSTPAVGFFNTTPQAQQAHIVDADGTLADITAKFNTLLADLEGYGLLASA
jgi:hypothetical protein